MHFAYERGYLHPAFFHGLDVQNRYKLHMLSAVSLYSVIMARGLEAVLTVCRALRALFEV